MGKIKITDALDKKGLIALFLNVKQELYQKFNMRLLNFYGTGWDHHQYGKLNI